MNMCDGYTLRELLDNKGFWTIAGIILGIGLGEAVRVYRDRRRRARLLNALRDELETLTHFIPEKLRIVQQMLDHLANRQILRGNSIHAPVVVYDSHFAEIYDRLTPIQRHNLHIIYNRLKATDVWLDNFEDDIKKDLDMKIMTDPWSAYRDKLEDIQNNYSVLLTLIRDYLNGNPVDVLHINR